jgi:tetratricopeptide (TPR) repeat protein
MKKIILFLIFIFFFLKQGKCYYEFDANLKEAYKLLLELHFDDSRRLIDEEKIKKPSNNLSLLYENYIDFLKVFISEDPSLFRDLKTNTEERIKKLNRDPKNFISPYHGYVQAEILLQLALVRIKFNENVTSATEIRRVYRLVQKNQSDFPDFILNKKVSGFLHAIVGSVPPKFQWLIKLAGMNGTISEGLNELSECLAKIQGSEFDAYKTEVAFYIGNIYSVFSMQNDSIDISGFIKPLLKSSPLLVYVYSNIEMKRGNNDEALSELSAVISNQSIYPFYFLNYKRGLCRLRKLDLSSINDFKVYLDKYSGLSCIKAAYQKLAWAYFIQGDTGNYHSQISQCLEKGLQIIDDDKDAYYEARSGEMPNLYLLRSRLLFDGGYYRSALLEIINRQISSFPTLRDKIEITYRLGRIMQKQGNINKALEYYLQTIKNGSSSGFYFAANSALLIGNIMEEKKDYKTANNYYKKCLSLDYEQYKNSIDQKAKAGIERISKFVDGN